MSGPIPQKISIAELQAIFERIKKVAENGELAIKQLSDRKRNAVHIPGKASVLQFLERAESFANKAVGQAYALHPIEPDEKVNDAIAKANALGAEDAKKNRKPKK